MSANEIIFRGICEKIRYQESKYLATVYIRCANGEHELAELAKLMKKLSHLKSLTIDTGSLMEHLSKDFFHRQTNLICLELVSDSLISLPPKIFANLKKLCMLRLRTANLPIRAADIHSWKLTKKLESIEIESKLIASDAFDCSRALHGSKILKFGTGDVIATDQLHLPALIACKLKSNHKMCDLLFRTLTANKYERVGHFKLLQIVDCDFKADEYEAMLSRFNFEAIRIFDSNVDSIYSLRLDCELFQNLVLFSNQNIQFLTIENCKLNAIPDFIGRLENLSVLNLSNNKLKTLNLTVFQANRKLVLLNLARNQIEEINDRCELNSHDLLLIDLSGNSLKRVLDWPCEQIKKCAFLELKYKSFSKNELLLSVFDSAATATATTIRYGDLLRKKKLIGKSGFFVHFEEDREFFATILQNYECVKENCLKIQSTLKNEHRLKLDYIQLVNNTGTRGFKKTEVKIENFDNNIKAYYVSGYQDDHKYIIADGPQSKEQIMEFWQMVWQEKSSVIVSLWTEKELRKYEAYWPLRRNDSMVANDLKIVANQIHQFADHNTLDLLVTNEKTNKSRQIVLMQFKQWSTQQILNTLHLLNPFVNEMNAKYEQLLATNRIDRAPIIVHCTRTNDRSAVFCTIDIGLQQYRDQMNVNVYWILEKIYRQKPAIKMNYETFWMCFASILNEGVQLGVFKHDQFELLMRPITDYVSGGSVGQEQGRAGGR